MKFKNGDIITDTKFNETFEFEEERDSFAVKSEPARFRLATDDEKKALIK